MKSEEAKKKKEYHSKRWSFYKEKEKEAKVNEKRIGFRFKKDEY